MDTLRRRGKVVAVALLSRYERPERLDQVGEGPSGGHQLHDEPQPVVLVDDVEDPYDVVVTDAGCRPRLASRPLVRLPGGVGTRQVEHLFERDRTIQHVVMGTPDLAGPARPSSSSSR